MFNCLRKQKLYDLDTIWKSTFGQIFEANAVASKVRSINPISGTDVRRYTPYTYSRASPTFSCTNRASRQSQGPLLIISLNKALSTSNNPVPKTSRAAKLDVSRAVGQQPLQNWSRKRRLSITLGISRTNWQQGRITVRGWKWMKKRSSICWFVYSLLRCKGKNCTIQLKIKNCTKQIKNYILHYKMYCTIKKLYCIRELTGGLLPLLSWSLALSPPLHRSLRYIEISSPCMSPTLSVCWFFY